MSFFEFPNTRTYDSDLGWLIRNMKKLIEAFDALESWKAQHEEAYEELKKCCDDLQSGILPPAVIASLKKWLEEYGIDIIGELVKMVFFGLDGYGYFVAYIPESWDDIIFGTSGLDTFPAGIDYGHLTLSFEY